MRKPMKQVYTGSWIAVTLFIFFSSLPAFANLPPVITIPEQELRAVHRSVVARLESQSANDVRSHFQELPKELVYQLERFRAALKSPSAQDYPFLQRRLLDLYRVLFEVRAYGDAIAYNDAKQTTTYNPKSWYETKAGKTYGSITATSVIATLLGLIYPEILTVWTPIAGIGSGAVTVAFGMINKQAHKGMQEVLHIRDVFLARDSKNLVLIHQFAEAFEAEARAQKLEMPNFTSGDFEEFLIQFFADEQMDILPFCVAKMIVGPQ